MENGRDKKIRGGGKKSNLPGAGLPNKPPGLGAATGAPKSPVAGATKKINDNDLKMSKRACEKRLTDIDNTSTYLAHRTLVQVLFQILRIHPLPGLRDNEERILIMQSASTHSDIKFQQFTRC